MATLHPNFIVGIGGSAGGLNAYKALLDAMPSNTGMAFVIVSHILPTAISQLAKIVSGKYFTVTDIKRESINTYTHIYSISTRTA